MSGIGFWELIILLLLGLIVLGPERLPRVANQLGTWLGQARRMTRVMKRQLEEELDLEQDNRIRPARLSVPPPVAPRKEHDDRYSPAHGTGSVGTGVAADVAAPAVDPGTEAEQKPPAEAVPVKPDDETAEPTEPK